MSPGPFWGGLRLAIARTINRLKGKTTMLFIAHMLPKALLVDEVVRFKGAESVGQGSGAMLAYQCSRPDTEVDSLYMTGQACWSVSPMNYG